MRIGIYAQAPSSNGGVFRYTTTFLEMLRGLDLDDEFVVLHRRRTDLAVGALVGGKWSHQIVPTRVMDLLRDFGVVVVGEERARWVWYQAARLRSNSVVARPTREPHFDRRGERLYRESGLDFVLYPVYSTSAFETRIPSVVTVHDLNHRVYTEFPEVVALGEFERREYYFRNACRYATTLLVESDTGREDLLNFYGDTGVLSDHVIVLPMLPAITLALNGSEDDSKRVRQRYGLSGDYLFYPAQFWPHKNHLRLIQALHHLREGCGLTPTLVLGGSHSGTLRHRTFVTAMQTARRLGVHKQVRYLGFIPDQDMSGLYREAVGLVMPTFFGPTNIPVLEAFALGCPVVTSDIRGIREQTNGAAILVNPRDPEAIADGLRRLLTASDERVEIMRRGREVTSRYTAYDYRRILKRALADTKARLLETTPAVHR
jgi:glycosyltransferase involved in cell wall biosynthesis